MSVRLNVPLVNQLRSMSCWYASACMVAYFREAGPRLGLPDKWNANSGINLNDFIRLAQAEGLQSVKSPTSNLTEQQLEVLLRNYGPIWCAGRWDGVPHIVVLTGVENGQVYINDPNPAKGKRVETLTWFNQKLDNHVANCMMYKPPRSVN
ncbi:papain-like cysteine protease family protein [Teredinibacter sp. KSP-S5-2]|uniref:papain-like cysteine protease family protein n=1 Tax=Teredinibacter sp. KSP-S5-2 TaxID=3034506 RepID=UPI00293466D2|nr:papain-like cysteine protease family protein [Teredinibacter sp. KSP-S5-2]WNO10042.1 papain-like cysteine protease family protein [Teredinibacter sp. KSP-S5-2]